MRVVCALLLVAPGVAAAVCEVEVEALETAAGTEVAATFRSVAACDAKVAGEQFAAAAKRTGDVESLVALAEAALGAGMTAPVHGLLELIPDYAAREETARGLGARCTDDPAVLAFVTGLHAALRDRAFVAWSGALRSCRAEELTASLEALAAAPPASAFDDRYATVVDLYAARRRVAAIPVLERAAIAAARGGPFPVVVDALVKSGTPEGIGTRPQGEALDALVGALGRVAPAATPEQVTVIADKLVAMGAEDAAARLLVHIYPDRVQPGGGFVYGLAAIERCGEEALVHWAAVNEPGKRWAIAPDLQGPARAFARKLKCKEVQDFTVVTTPGPVASPSAVLAWAETVAQGAGTDVKLKEEAAVTLP